MKQPHSNSKNNVINSKSPTQNNDNKSIKIGELPKNCGSSIGYRDSIPKKLNDIILNDYDDSLEIISPPIYDLINYSTKCNINKYKSLIDNKSKNGGKSSANSPELNRKTNKKRFLREYDSSKTIDNMCLCDNNDRDSNEVNIIFLCSKFHSLLSHVCATKV